MTENAVKVELASVLAAVHTSHDIVPFMARLKPIGDIAWEAVA